MQIIKYENWTNYTAEPLVRLPAVGTNWHSVKLAFQGSNVVAYFDGALVTNLVDNGGFDGQPAYTNGGISIDMYAQSPTAYTFLVSNVAVTPLVLSSAYNTIENTALTVANPGVLSGDTDVYGTNLVAVLVTGPTNGTLNLSTNGGFTYTPATNFIGTDGFTFQASDNLSNLGVATATISVLPATTVTNVINVVVNDTNRMYGAANPVFTVSYSGFVNGDGTNVLTGSPVISTTTTTNSPVGDYPITISQGTLSAANYVLAFVNGTLSVTNAVLGITADSTNRMYGAANPVFTVSYNGFVNGDTAGVLGGALVVSSAADTNSPVGTYPIVASGLTASNYVFSYTNGVLEVTNAPLTVSANDTNKVYGTGLEFAGNEFTVSGLVSTDSVAGAGVMLTSAGTNAGAAAGSYAISITNLVGENGLTNYLKTYVPGTLTVNPAGLTVSVDNQERGYGQTNPVLTGSVSANGDGITASFMVAADTNSPAGEYPIAVSLSDPGGRLGNYTVTTNGGVLEVTNALLTVSANDTNKEYGQLLGFAGNEFTVSGLVSTDYVSGVSLSSAGQVANAAAGSYAINITNAAGDAGLTNYQITYVPGTLSVGQAGLGVSANSTNRMYGAANPVFTVSYNGFVNGDTAGVLGGALVVSSAADTNSPVGTYPIVASGLTASNYVFSYTNGVLEVTNAPLTVSANDTNKVYGTGLEFAGNEFTVSGLVSTDSVAGAGVMLTSAGTNAGAAAGSYANQHYESSWGERVDQLPQDLCARNVDSESGGFDGECG